MLTTTFCPGAQSYKGATIEAQKFSCGWTSVIYWDDQTQSVAFVGAANHDAAVKRAEEIIDACLELNAG